MKITLKNFRAFSIISSCILLIAIPLDTAVYNTISFAQESNIEKADVKRAKEDLIKSGRLYYRSKRYEAAINEWEEALSLEPENRKIKKYINEAKRRLDLQAKKEAKKKTKRKLDKEKRLISIAAPPKGMLTVYSLNDCINMAVENHLPLQIAKKSVRLAEMRVLEARRNLLPSATFVWEESEGRVYAKRYTGKKEYIEGQQPIFHGGELYFTLKQTGVNLEITRNDYNRIKNDLILQVKKGYYTLAKAKENLKMQKELSQTVDKISDMVKNEFESGVASKLEYLNVSSQASQVKFQLASAEGDVSVAGLILKQAMNLDIKENVEIEPELGFKKVSIDFEKVLQAAFINRPEMKIHSLMIDYYRYGKNIARAKGLPKIDFLGSWGLAKEEYVSEDFDNRPDKDIDRKLSPQWYAGLKASMPFWGSTGEFSWTKEEWVPVVSAVHGTEATTKTLKLKVLDKLDYYSDKQLADIDYDRTRQELNKIKQDITLEARESCFSYEKALLQLETASNKVKYQEKDVEFMKLKREMDEVPDSNVIEGMIRLAQEKFGYAQALNDCHIALATINKAVGVEDYFKFGELDSEKTKR